MIEVTVTARIDAPPDAVWETICDLRLVPDWVEGTVAMTRMSSPVVAAGVTYSERTRVAGPIVIQTHWEITEFEPPHRQVHAGRGVLGGGVLTLEVEPADTGTTYIQTVRLKTPLGRFLEPRLRTSLEANVPGLERVLRERAAVR